MIFDHVFEIQRAVRVEDGQGGQKENWLAVQTGVSGSLRPASARERLSAAQQQTEVTHVVYFPYGTDVRHGDRVRMTDQAGPTIVITAVRNPGYRNHHLECDGYEIQTG